MFTRQQIDHLWRATWLNPTNWVLLLHAYSQAVGLVQAIAGFISFATFSVFLAVYLNIDPDEAERTCCIANPSSWPAGDYCDDDHSLISLEDSSSVFRKSCAGTYVLHGVVRAIVIVSAVLWAVILRWSFRSAKRNFDTNIHSAIKQWFIYWSLLINIFDLYLFMMGRAAGISPIVCLTGGIANGLGTVIFALWVAIAQPLAETLECMREQSVYEQRYGLCTAPSAPINTDESLSIFRRAHDSFGTEASRQMLYVSLAAIGFGVCIWLAVALVTHRRFRKSRTDL